MVFGHTFNRVSSLLCQDTRLFRNSMPVHHEPQQCRSDTGRHPSNLCGVSINIVMYHVREGVKKMFFFGRSLPNVFIHPPTPGFLWDLEKLKVNFGSKKRFFMPSLIPDLIFIFLLALTGALNAMVHQNIKYIQKIGQFLRFWAFRHSYILHVARVTQDFFDTQYLPFCKGQLGK